MTDYMADEHHHLHEQCLMYCSQYVAIVAQDYGHRHNQRECIIPQED